MAKFNQGTVKPAVASPVVSEQVPSGLTYEGGAGYARAAKSELFLLAVSNMVGETTFYETADHRDTRFEQLVHEVAVADVDWMVGFVRWLRGEVNMRSAALVVAAETVKGRQAAGLPGGGRQIVDAALQRADEPGELIAYWLQRHGRKIPIAVKRGVADAVVRLYTERSLLKYDGRDRAVRFGDVIDLTQPAYHRPEVRGSWRYTLYGHALDRRHNRDNGIPDELQMLHRNARLRADGSLDDWLNPDVLREAGMTWEDALSAVGSKVNKARLWAALVPSMGYMALLRNLRNFDDAGVPNGVRLAQVAAKLADPEQVTRSRQLPMRFLSAYRAARSLRWAWPLEQALGHAVANVPALPGRTLVLVDTSTSMNAGFSKDGTLRRWDAAVIFGVALAQRCASAEVVSFSSTARHWGDQHGAHTKAFPLQGGESLLRAVERWKSGGWFLGGGTATAAALRRHFAGHDRVVIVTDEQAGSDITEVSASVPRDVPMYTWNLAGYEHGHAPSGRNRHTFGGLNDSAFRMVPLLEAGRDAGWPWETTAG